VIHAYPLLVLAGLAIGWAFWSRSARRERIDVTLYFAAAAGAFIGAKVSYLIAEGWMFWDLPDHWKILATGKSVLGAIIGGYLAVEAIKRLAGIGSITGDAFAAFVPLSLAIGRVGCMIQGCCPGRTFGQNPAWRWPAQEVEFAFNLGCFLLFFWMRRKGVLPGQHFHLFMMAYGLFRFLHEPLRATPKLVGDLSGYQVLALILFGLGLNGFLRRRRDAKSCGSHDRG